MLWDRLMPVPSTLHTPLHTLNCTAFAIASAVDNIVPKEVQVRAPSEQSKINERLERMRSREGKLLVEAAAIGTAAARASRGASTRPPQPPL